MKQAMKPNPKPSEGFVRLTQGPSETFVRRGRNPDEQSPWRFEPTIKAEGDIVL